MSDERELWSRYWRESATRGCTDAFPAQARARIADGWRARLAGAGGGRLLDIACGRGAVLALARDAGIEDVTGIDLAGVDDADAAIRGGIDARALPFANRSFDVVVSQFGVEYAGLGVAALEAARVCSGSLILLVHDADGVVAAHAAEQVAQVDWLRDARALDRLRAHFAAPSAASAADVDRLLAAIGERAAGHANVALLEGVYRAAITMQDDADPAGALDRLARDLADHAARMRALAAVAPTRAALENVAVALRGAGFTVTTTDEGSPPLGRWLDAVRYGRG